MYQFWLGGILLPVTPGDFTIKINDKDKTVSMINESEVNILKSPGLKDVTIPELLLPTQRYPFVQSEAKIDPDYYLGKLEKWKNERKPIKFKVIRLKTNKLLWNTDMYVTIGSYEVEENVDKYGGDVCVKLNLKEWKYWGAKKLVPKKNKKNGKTYATIKGSRMLTKSVAKIYTVKSGDTLMIIAKKQLNNASAWKKIYQLNQKIIEDAARKHGRKSSSFGHYLYVGTTLRLPKV